MRGSASSSWPDVPPSRNNRKWRANDREDDGSGERGSGGRNGGFDLIQGDIDCGNISKSDTQPDWEERGI